MGVKILAQGYSVWPLAGFEPMWLAIIKLQSWCINHMAMPPQSSFVTVIFLF
jgi:hypothetical protein